MRFHRSAGIQREQTKWLAYAVGMSVLCVDRECRGQFSAPNYPWKTELSITVSNLGILGIAVAAAIAILRHRLYNIDS